MNVSRGGKGVQSEGMFSPQLTSTTSMAMPRCAGTPEDGRPSWRSKSKMDGKNRSSEKTVARACAQTHTELGTRCKRATAKCQRRPCPQGVRSETGQATRTRTKCIAELQRACRPRMHGAGGLRQQCNSMMCSAQSECRLAKVLVKGAPAGTHHECCEL